MSAKKDNITDDLQGLFKRTLEINTRYFKEGTELVRRMSKKSQSGTDLNLFQPEEVAKAFTAFARLNLEHYQNVLDLGLELTRQAVSDNPSQDVKGKAGNPAFVLTGNVEPGNKVRLDFVLDNTMKEQVECHFNHTVYTSDTDPNVSYEFDTEFSPQSFPLAPGESQNVTIEIRVDSDVKPGNYTSRIEVLGFEPLFFLVKLNIPENSTKKTGNGKKKGE
jgi:hypothetical protein